MPNPSHKYLKAFIEAFLVLSTLALVGVMLWGLDRGFDVTDEGYNLLGLLPGQEKQTIYTALQFVLLSRLFGWVDGLIQSRVLSLVLTSLSALVFAWGLMHMLRRLYPRRVVLSGFATAAWLLGSSFFYNVALSLTFSYNVFINAGMLLTAGLALYAFSISDLPTGVRRLRWSWAAVGALLLMATFVKPTAAVLLTLLYLAGGVGFGVGSSRGFFKNQAGPLLLGALVGLAFLHFGLNAVQPVLQTLNQGVALHPSHQPQDLLNGLWRDAKDLVKALIPFIGLILGVTLFAAGVAFSKKAQTAWAGRVGWIFIALLGLASAWGSPLFHEAILGRTTKRVPLLLVLLVILLLLAAAVGPGLISRLKLSMRPRLSAAGGELEKLVVAGILLCLPLAAAFGTNNLLMWQLWLHVTPWLALLLLLFQETQLARWSWAVGWVVLAFTAAWFWSQWVVTYFVWPYRLVDNRVTNSEPLNVRSARLNGIKVDARTKAHLEGLDQIIAGSKFQKGDGVIALYNMPGLVYLFEGYSPGDPWYLDDDSWYNTLLDSMLHSKLARKSQYLVTNQFLSPELETFLTNSEIDFPDSYRQLGRLTNPIRIWDVTIYERRR